MQKSKNYLPDINVWLAFVSEAHQHHAVSRAFMDQLDPRQAAFCRISQMGLLRLLTNSAVMHRNVLTQAQAWNVHAQLARDERFQFLDEPPGLQERWRELTLRSSPSQHLWTDCYLQAFAACRELQVVTFDRTFGGSAHSGAYLLGS